jgi:hypothetical protein
MSIGQTFGPDVALSYGATDYAWSGGLLWTHGMVLPASDPTSIHSMPPDPEEEALKTRAAHYRVRKPQKGPRRLTVGLCLRCKRQRGLKARGLCQPCYVHEGRHDNLARWPPMAKRER